MSRSVLRRTARGLAAAAAFHAAAIITAAAQPAVDYALPAPGCPTKFPTYKSVSAICRPLEDKGCQSNDLCHWVEKSKRCYPTEGTITADLDPAVYKKLGLPEAPDYIEAGLFKIACTPGTRCEPGPPEYLEKGQDYFQKRQFGAAIGEYSKALKSNPNIPEVLSWRALAYELSGDKASAIADYCRILVIYSKRERRANARERIAQLSSQPDARPPTTTTAAPPVSAPPPNLQPVPPPSRSSTIDDGRGRKIAPFSVEVGEGNNYLVKLVNVRNDRDQILMFVKSGETYSTKVPLGEYAIRAATGAVWYGKKELFGPDTRFVRMRTRDGNQQSFVFYRQGNTVHGKRLILKKIFSPAEGGNMEEEKISREEF